MPFAWLQSGSITLPPLPKWGGAVHSALALDAVFAIRRHSPQCYFGEVVDNRFVEIPAAGLRPLISWAMKLQAAIGGFKPEGRDCDDFADAFDLAASWQVRSCNIEAAPVVGCIYVTQSYAWANVPAGGRHALNCVLTDEGLYIVEPQNGQCCPIQDYPNRASIDSVNGF